MSPAARREYFDALASRWDAIPSPPGAGEGVRRFLASVVAPAHRRVLDVGCGTGLLAPGLLEGPRRVVELDFAFGMLAEDRRKHPDPRLAFVCADAARLPFRGACFDLVLCFGILPHLERPEQALRELLGVLRPGGRLAVGHLMGSEALNAFHASLDGPVNQDRLPAAGDLARLFEKLGARVVAAAEAADSYLVSVET
jgi:ubiquinone/menaquinone biosynthesis C-methylase UbiE